MDCFTKDLEIDRQLYRLEIRDTPGLDPYAEIVDEGIRDSEGFVLVYSISSHESFKRVEDFYCRIQRIKGSAGINSPDYLGSPISQTTSTPCRPLPTVLVGNQCDRLSGREVSFDEGRNLAKQLSCEFFEVSAKDGSNVEEAFSHILRQLLPVKPDHDNGNVKKHTVFMLCPDLRGIVRAVRRYLLPIYNKMVPQHSRDHTTLLETGFGRVAGDDGAIW